MLYYSSSLYIFLTLSLKIFLGMDQGFHSVLQSYALLSSSAASKLAEGGNACPSDGRRSPSQKDPEEPAAKKPRRMDTLDPVTKKMEENLTCGICQQVAIP
jgi:hypothetical protein